MGKRIVFSTMVFTLSGWAAILAQSQTSQHPMTFFVTSTVPGSGPQALVFRLHRE
jgi:hypothetical protein